MALSAHLPLSQQSVTQLLCHVQPRQQWGSPTASRSVLHKPLFFSPPLARAIQEGSMFLSAVVLCSASEAGLGVRCISWGPGGDLLAVGSYDQVGLDMHSVHYRHMGALLRCIAKSCTVCLIVHAVDTLHLEHVGTHLLACRQDRHSRAFAGDSLSNVTVAHPFTQAALSHSPCPCLRRLRAC